jgi:hypothetical protein
MLPSDRAVLIKKLSDGHGEHARKIATELVAATSHLHGDEWEAGEELKFARGKRIGLAIALSIITDEHYVDLVTFLDGQFGVKAKVA